MAVNGHEGPLKIKTKVYLTDADENAFMGIGVIWLLEKIDAYGSMRKAAESMNLSYAKAFRMVKEAEEGLGLCLIHRKRGGDARRGAELTDDAGLLLASYKKMQKAIKEEANTRFSSFLEEIGPRIESAGSD